MDVGCAAWGQGALVDGTLAGRAARLAIGTRLEIILFGGTTHVDGGWSVVCQLKCWLVKGRYGTRKVLYSPGSCPTAINASRRSLARTSGVICPAYFRIAATSIVSTSSEMCKLASSERFVVDLIGILGKDGRHGQLVRKVGVGVCSCQLSLAIRISVPSDNPISSTLAAITAKRKSLSTCSPRRIASARAPMTNGQQHARAECRYRAA